MLLLGLFIAELGELLLTVDEQVERGRTLTSHAPQEDILGSGQARTRCHQHPSSFSYLLRYSELKASLWLKTVGVCSSLNSLGRRCNLMPACMWHPQIRDRRPLLMADPRRLDIKLRTCHLNPGCPIETSGGVQSLTRVSDPGGDVKICTRIRLALILDTLECAIRCSANS